MSSHSKAHLTHAKSDERNTAGSSISCHGWHIQRIAASNLQIVFCPLSLSLHHVCVIESLACNGHHALCPYRLHHVGVEESGIIFSKFEGHFKYQANNHLYVTWLQIQWIYHHCHLHWIVKSEWMGGVLWMGKLCVSKAKSFCLQSYNL